MLRTLAALGLLAAAVPAPAADAKRPNVLFVFTDDQRWDTIRALGNPEVETPTLDALVGRGFVFANPYCQGSMIPAVCAPSRTMLLTGKSLFRIPQPQAKTYDGPTLGGTFKAAGYDTLCVSKPGNSFRVGHDQFGKVVHIPHAGAETSARCANAVIDFLKDAKGDKPFFVYLAPSMPHDPRTAPPEFHKKYDPAKVTLSKNFLPKHPFDNGELEIRDEKLAPVPRTDAEMKKHLADYYACVSAVDHDLGRILALLREQKRLDDTLVIFSSDQGLAVGGRHGLMGKQNLYEHVKPPLIVAGPGVPAGKSAALVYLFDLFPTLCDLTGVPDPKGLEGSSLKPVIEGKKPGVRESLFGAYKDVQRMARDGRWKVLWYPQVDRYQLFDLSADPDEVNDLHDKPEHAAKLADMKKLLAGQQDAFADRLAKRPK
jgi:arylsulfatase A-like enzyme